MQLLGFLAKSINEVMRSQKSGELNPSFEEYLFLLEPYKRQVWIPVTEPRDGGLLDSKFSGIPWLESDESWPCCGNCGSPMHFFFQLDLSGLPDPELKSLGPGLLQMFRCQSTIDCRTFSSPFTSRHYIRTISPKKESANIELPNSIKSFPSKVVVGWDETHEYPHWTDDDFPRIGDTHITELEGFDDDMIDPWRGEKIGGWPFLTQGSGYFPRCPDCGRVMKYLMQLGSVGDIIPVGFGDTGTGHITYCPHHPYKFGFTSQCF